MAVMAWFKKERKPRTSQRERLEIPPDAWEKCDDCGHIDIREKFEKALNVCPECGDHRRFSAEEYIELLTDEGIVARAVRQPALGRPARTSSITAERLGLGAEEGRRRRRHLHRVGANSTGCRSISGVMNFAFMGGSMGSVVGEKIARLAQRSHEKRLPLVMVWTSGGARMQEGVLSLMQMAKTSAAIAQLQRAAIPYISILTDPTTGGVSASFAMQGDVILAEPGAVIGFAGQRVIKQTIGQDLPEGFQTAEFLLEKGQVDDVVPRASLRDTTARLLRHMRSARRRSRPS